MGIVWSICQNCKYFNFLTDEDGQDIDLENDEFDMDFDGIVDCDKAKDYLEITKGIISMCPGYEGL